MKKHRILSLLLAAIMLIPANVTALAYDRTSKEPPSSTERVEQLRNSGLESLESADPIDPLEEITAIVQPCPLFSDSGSKLGQEQGNSNFAGLALKFFLRDGMTHGIIKVQSQEKL